MSRLLGLREWLGLIDAMRYMRVLGMEGSQKDFFLAYAAAELPMKITCQRGDFFTLAAETPNCYPHYLGAVDWNGRACKTDSGNLYPADSEMFVASGKWQQGYNQYSAVWVNDPLSFDLKRQEVEPIYHALDFDDGPSRFEHLTWGDLMMDWAEGALQFSRPHIEELVSRALGKKSDTPAQASEPASYTTRLLQIQSEAIQKWWVNYDPAEPDTAPDKSAIIDWLTSEKGCTRQSAEAIDLIIRHDSRKSGGAKPKG